MKKTKPAWSVSTKKRQCHRQEQIGDHNTTLILNTERKKIEFEIRLRKRGALYIIKEFTAN